MERRKNGRWRRRLPVRFWSRGEEKPRPGHTLNLSGEGMYIGTDRPVASGTRVRVEVLDAEEGFVTEGVVTHSHRMARELQQIKPSGMGVRFLRPQELLAPFGAPGARAGDAGARPAGAATVAAPARRSPPPRPQHRPLARAATATGPSSRQPPLMPTLTGLNLAPNGVLPIRFRTIEDLRAVFERDMRHGGLFVTTSSPADLDQLVSLHLHLPEGRGQVVVPARVVHRAPGSASGAPSGMGVQFLDPDGVLAQLRSQVEELQEE